MILLSYSSKTNALLEIYKDSINQIQINSASLIIKDEIIYKEYGLEPISVSSSTWKSENTTKVRNYITEAALEESFFAFRNNLSVNMNAELIRGPI